MRGKKVSAYAYVYIFFVFQVRRSIATSETSNVQNETKMHNRPGTDSSSGRAKNSSVYIYIFSRSPLLEFSTSLESFLDLKSVIENPDFKFDLSVKDWISNHSQKWIWIWI